MTSFVEQRPALMAGMLLGLMACGDLGAAVTDPVNFSRDVLPILSDNCFKCHGPDAKEARKGDLRLDDEADVKRDRDGYHVVKPAEPDKSELYQRLIHGDPDEKMPPADSGRVLSAAQIETLRRWIEQGANWGRHWAFERVKRPVLPASDRHPVDVLVERQLKRVNLEPNPRATRETLIRRLSLDLTGLPPTPAQVDQFLADDKPGAWLRLIDRTLNSPAYGERMAWDWLDAARYADSNGYQGDGDRSMWPWRDWVVRAFNDNLPYDTFTVWQLAGDLLPDATDEQILATGFNRNHMINGEGGRIAEENRVDYVFDITETMGTVWLGLTLNCCRCHDHKFDPLTQREYYQFTAFFNQVPIDGGGGNPRTPPVLPVPSESETRRMNQESRVRDWLEGSVKALDEGHGLTDTLKRLRDDAENRRREIEKRLPQVMVMKDRDKPRTTYILDRGLYNQRRDEVTAAGPAALLSLEKAGERANRLDLARWLVSRDHPLTARVTVNRFWQMIFGIGLVKTSEDFGVQAEYPVQRDLLDWLAVEFMESGWDVKHLLRTLVTSETYRRSAVVRSPGDRESDPANRYFARGPRFRMPSWMIRDQALAVSGILDPQLGGPPVFSYQPEGVWADATFGKKRYSQARGAPLYRRSLYTFWRRIVGPSMFFDTAKRQICEVKPLRTNTPMHALNTLNGVTYVEASRLLAAELIRQGGSDRDRMRRAVKRVLGRDLSDDEGRLWERSLKRAQDAFASDPQAAADFLSHGDSKRDDGLPVATHAAWAAVCLNLLNLDETLTKE